MFSAFAVDSGNFGGSCLKKLRFRPSQDLQTRICLSAFAPLCWVADFRCRIGELEFPSFSWGPMRDDF